MKTQLNLHPGQIEPLGTHIEQPTAHLYIIAFQMFEDGQLTRAGNYEVFLDKPFGPGSTQIVADYIRQAITGRPAEDDDLEFIRITGMFHAGEHTKPPCHRAGAWVDVSGGENG